ncbi:MAG: hypothetical protein WBQ72_12795 [Terriglobales bacterium]
MTGTLPHGTLGWTVMCQAGGPPLFFDETEIDLWAYRPKTTALLKRYARVSVEVGHLPCLLGREFFRARVSRYSTKNFEDTIVFVTDIEHTLDKMGALEKKLIAMHIFEEYTVFEISRSLACCERTVQRLLHEAIDQLSRVLIARGLLDRFPRAEDLTANISAC